jgi:hypothetical protein
MFQAVSISHSLEMKCIEVSVEWWSLKVLIH